MVIKDPGLAEMLNDSSIDRVMAVDNNLYIIAWNRTSTEYTGIKAEEVLGRHLLHAFPRYEEDEEMMHALRLALSGVKSFVPAKKDAFNRHYFENHFIPLKREGNQVIGVMNIMHDVAHRVKAEEQLFSLNKTLQQKYDELDSITDELSTFTFIASNNIKEPMRQVYSSIELLIRAEGQSLSNGGKANLRRIQSSLSRMNLLLDDILVLSNINKQGRTPETVDLDKVLQQTRMKLKDKLVSYGASIEAEQLPNFTGYADLLHHFFYHMLNHLIRFTRPGDFMQYRIDARQAIMSDAMSNQGGRNFMRIGFAFDGIYTDQSKTKIDLAICRKILSIHHGFMEIETTTGNGTKLLCYFPFHFHE